MIRYNKLLVAVGAAALSACLYTTTASAASVSTATASANVITPMTIAENTALHFGDVGVGAGGGDVTLAPGGGRSVTAGDAEIIAGGANTPGTFTITGEPNKAYTLTYPAAPVDISGGTGTMDVDNFTDNSAGTMPAGGTETFNVGATLTIGGGQAAGLYSNTYTLTVNYQ